MGNKKASWWRPVIDEDFDDGLVRFLVMETCIGSESCEVVLPELGLDLSSSLGKFCWADDGEGEGSVALGREVAVSGAANFEEGEVLSSPSSGEQFTVDVGVTQSGGVIAAPEKEVLGCSQDGEIGDDPAMNMMVDLILKDERLPPPCKPWSDLFAHNRMPCSEHKLNKMGYDVPRLPNGSLDLSNGFELRLFDEDPQCLIGFPIGRYPIIASLKGMTMAWGVPVEFQPHPSGWIVFWFSTEHELLGVL
ncbi:hypothetical protein Dimus_001618 [Dionaea muscipula]